MFQTADFKHLARFNSANSSTFLDFYENCVDERVRASIARVPHKTFAASSLRCDRRSWFRLRGTVPDVPKQVDTTLQFTADVGTALHKIVQTDLKNGLKDKWIDVNKHLRDIEFPYEYTIQADSDGLECLIELKKPPIRFACDGIVEWDNKRYLLEIKTSEFSSWDRLTDPKSEHIDQVKCYASLLDLEGVLFLYVDRQYGGVKCFEMSVSEADRQDILDRMWAVIDMVDKNLAPKALPHGDKWCQPTHCPYYKKCAEYGR